MAVMYTLYLHNEFEVLSGYMEKEFELAMSH
jgi:hypothetical protein